MDIQSRVAAIRGRLLVKPSPNMVVVRIDCTPAGKVCSEGLSAEVVKYSTNGGSMEDSGIGRYHLDMRRTLCFVETGMWVIILQLMLGGIQVPIIQ